MSYFDYSPSEKTLYPATLPNVLTTFSAMVKAGTKLGLVVFIRFLTSYGKAPTTVAINISGSRER